LFHGGGGISGCTSTGRKGGPEGRKEGRKRRKEEKEGQNEWTVYKYEYILVLP